MGFRKDAYATIWELDRKEKFTNVKLSTSRKNKETGQYKDDFSGYVRFIGKAHDLAANLQVRDRIQIDSCDVTTNYDKEKEKRYTNFLVFDATKQEPRQESEA